MPTYLCDVFVPGGPHFFLCGLATLWIFSAAVSAMNAPDGKSSPGYQWLYRFAHLLAANLDRAGLLNFTAAAMPEERSGKEPGSL